MSHQPLAAKLDNNHFFALFNLPVGFDIDATLLKTRFLELQKIHHPDVNQNKPEAKSNSTLINHAYQTLNEPHLRAAYLLDMAKESVAPDDSIDDIDFLDSMMDLRIALEETDNQDDIANLQKKVTLMIDTEGKHFNTAFTNSDYKQAKIITQKLHFLAKLNQAINEKLSCIHIDTNDDDLYM